MRRLTFSIPWPFTGAETRDLLAFIFHTTLLTYLGLFFLESLKPGFVTAYLNLQWWLEAAIVVGIVTALWPKVVPTAQSGRSSSRRSRYMWCILLGIGTVGVMWYKLASLGTTGQVLAGLSGLIATSLSLVIWSDWHDSDQ